ncbi:hypothetical protein ACKFKF_26765 [Phormidesmis sp. 146-12]
MSKQPEVVKQSDLLNQFVLDRRSLQELGQIEVLWMYLKVHRVLGFICKSGLLGRKKTAFNLDQLDTIGANGVLVNSQPVETDIEKVRQLESLVNCEVWTDAGNKAGKVVDYLFDLETGVIEHYLFISSSVTGSIYKLPPNYILSLGNRRVLVSEAAVRSFAIYQEGLQEKLYKAADFFKEEKTQVTQEFKSLFQQAKERAQIFNEQLKEKAELLAEQAKETGQVFVEQVKERTHEVAEIWDDWENEPIARPASAEPDPLEDWDDDDFSEPVEKAVEVQPNTEIIQKSAAEAEPFDGWDDDDFIEPTIDVSAKPIADQKLIASSNQPPEDPEDDDPWI